MRQTDIETDTPTPEDIIAASIARGCIDGRQCSAEERAAQIAAALTEAKFVILPDLAGRLDAINAAIRTGDFSGITDRDWRAHLAATQAGFVTRASMRGTRGTPGYDRALSVVRGHNPSVASVAEALGDASPNGHQGNLWLMLDAQLELNRMGAVCGAFVGADGTVKPLYKESLDAGVIAIVDQDLTLQPGRIDELPPGTRIHCQEAATPERAHWGLYERTADDLARQHGCRVEVAGLDDAMIPLDCDMGPHAVVVESSTGRIVGLVQCWESEDGDPLVPETWLKTVLVAWQADAVPQRAVV